MFHRLNWFALIVIALMPALCSGDPPPTETVEAVPQDDRDTAVEESGEKTAVKTPANEGKDDPKSNVVWHTNLEESIRTARDSGKPIFVVVGAPWCVFCEKLEDEIDDDLASELAKKWVLAKINADNEHDDARELRADALPSLRLLSSDGIVTVSKDGYLPKAALKTWLTDNYDMTKARMPALLTKDIESLDESEIQTLISLMALRDVTARRVVLNRLTDMPKQAAGPTIEMLAKGKLAEQLSAIHLLREWKAPVDGIDPWDPESIDEKAIQTVKDWRTQKFPDK